jgi:hypothetical protein
MYGEMERTVKEAVVTHFQTLSRHLPGDTLDNHQSG